MDNRIKLLKFKESRPRTMDSSCGLITDYLLDELLISEDKTFIIHNKTRFPLTYIKTIKFGDPLAMSTKADIILAQRDVSIFIVYRTEGRDLTIVSLFDGQKYKFDHIKFSNREYR